MQIARTTSRAWKLAKEILVSEEVPRFLTHIVTFRCNARCQMCDSWRKPKGVEADLAQIAVAYGRVGPLDGVRLTGGEPFVRTDFDRIATLALEILKPLYLHVTTNGFLTERIVDFCRRRDPSVPLHLMVSIDGLEDAHDRIRGCDRAFQRAWETLETLAPQRRRWNLRLSVNQTIVDREGVLEAERLRNRLSPLGIPHQVVLAYADSGTYSSDWTAESEAKQIGNFTPLAQLGRPEIDALLAIMEGEEARADFATRVAKRLYRKHLAAHLLHERPPKAPTCAALHRHLRLYPDGSVPVCQFNPSTVGNLVRQELSDILDGDEGRKARAWVKNCPGCLAECELVPSALYSGALLHEALRG